MIEELKDFDRNIDPYDYKEPLLEYAEEVANHFWGDYDPARYVLEDGTEVEGQYLPSIVPHDFACRYLDGEIDKRKENVYLESKEVQETIKAFGLDSTKFWYLCLMVKDYVDSRTNDAIKMNPAHREELVRLIEELDKLHPKFENHTISCVGTGELYVKVGKDKKFTITDGVTLSLINAAVSFLIGYSKKYTNLLDSSSLNFNKRESLPHVYQIYLFNQYLSWFLKPKKTKKVFHASKDKSLLISRMTYILGITFDDRFYEEYSDAGERNNFLKRYLSKYKNIDIKTISNIYLV
jgi:hypothetical protein